MNRIDLAPTLSHDELDAANGGNFLGAIAGALGGLTGAYAPRSVYGDYGFGYGGPVLPARYYADDYVDVDYVDYVDYGPGYGGGLYGGSPYMNINPLVPNGYAYAGYPGSIPTGPLGTLGTLGTLRI